MITLFPIVVFLKVFEKVLNYHGRLDLLFNNAGISAPNLLLEDLSVEQWKSVIDVNLTGSFLCAQQAIQIMKNQYPQGGRIINNGSISAGVELEKYAKKSGGIDKDDMLATAAILKKGKLTYEVK